MDFKNTVVHVTTTDQIREVDKITGQDHSYLYNGLIYGGTQCIELSNGRHSDISYFKRYGYTILSYDEFMSKYRLPEKWCIQMGNNLEVAEWFLKQEGAFPDYATHSYYKEGYFHFPRYEYDNYSYYHNHFIVKGYTEITFDQFKRLVLKQNNMRFKTEEEFIQQFGEGWMDIVENGWDEDMNVLFGQSENHPEASKWTISPDMLTDKPLNEKKIIGYKCPKDLYGKYSPKGTIWAKQEFAKTYSIKDSDGSFVMPAEIVEQWEVVYQQEFKKGDWVYFTGLNGGVTQHWKIGIVGKIRFIGKRISSIAEQDVELVDFDGSNDSKNFRLATEEEIKDHLIKAAKERGFIHGKYFTAVRDTEPNKEMGVSGLGRQAYSKEKGEIGSGFVYNPDTDTLCTSGYGLFVVYSQGKWATLKEDGKVVTLKCDKGSFNLEVSKEGIYYKPENKWLDIFALKAAIGTTIVSTYKFKPVTIDAGCMKNTLVSEWENVLKIYDEFQKEN